MLLVASAMVTQTVTENTDWHMHKVTHEEGKKDIRLIRLLFEVHGPKKGIEQIDIK